MDSRGWIPIDLLAQFNRVRTLTTETQLVVEVLMLSSIVEVRGTHVRPRQWQQFVLPNAPQSTIESVDGQVLDPQVAAVPIEQNQPFASPVPEGTTGQNHEGEEDEEEDVVFVINNA